MSPTHSSLKSLPISALRSNWLPIVPREGGARHRYHRSAPGWLRSVRAALRVRLAWRSPREEPDGNEPHVYQSGGHATQNSKRAAMPDRNAAWGAKPETKADREEPPGFSSITRTTPKNRSRHEKYPLSAIPNQRSDSIDKVPKKSRGQKCLSSYRVRSR